jgi:hypothetical protein
VAPAPYRRAVGDLTGRSVDERAELILSLPRSRESRRGQLDKLDRRLRLNVLVARSYDGDAVVTILTQDRREFEVTPEEGRALSDELDALGAGDQMVDTREGATLVVTSENVRTTARALDHLRNRGDMSREANDARDALLRALRIAPIEYRLRSWQFDAGEQDKTFWSYTGTYQPGDRLITGAGEVLEVASVEHEASPLEPGVLAVDRLRR